MKERRIVIIEGGANRIIIDADEINCVSIESIKKKWGAFTYNVAEIILTLKNNNQFIGYELSNNFLAISYEFKEIMKGDRSNCLEAVIYQMERLNLQEYEDLV